MLNQVTLRLAPYSMKCIVHDLEVMVLNPGRIELWATSK